MFNDNMITDIMDLSVEIMDAIVTEYPRIVHEADLKETFIEIIDDLFDELFDFDEEEEDDIYDTICEAVDIYITLKEGNEIKKEIKENSHIHNPITTILHGLRNEIQPDQRTPEWYNFRYNLITASNAYKAFGTQCQINSLIYEKCKPLTMDNITHVNTSSPMHWGQMYEPVSVAFYEHTYKTKIELFGCIKHPVHSFLGASPDGINVDMTNPHKYGKMLEIKNVTSRKITGVPLIEYWTQVQLQMEVCNLDTCDLFETQFVEYDSIKDFNNDYIDENKLNISKASEHKGIIIQFMKKYCTIPHYEYMPIHYSSRQQIDEWYNQTILSMENENKMFVRFHCWKLSVHKCTHIDRNKEWFNNHIGKLKNVWEIIEKERISGYEHRKAKSNGTGTAASGAATVVHKLP